MPREDHSPQIHRYEAPSMYVCNDCEQAFVSYDMYWSHREVIEEDRYYKIEANDEIGDLSGVTLGYEPCEVAQND